MLLNLQPVPNSQHVMPLLAAWNEAHNAEHMASEYADGRLCSRHFDREAMAGFDWTDSSLATLLRHCADLVTDHRNDPLAMADVYCFLRHVTLYIPKVECWVVWKNYAETDPTSHWYGKRVPWCGLLSEEQAREFAPAIETFYKEKNKHLSTFDTFTVEFGKCPVHDMMVPGLKAADYVRMLG